MAKRRDFHPILVPALDALIGNPDILAPDAETKLKAETLYIPMQYIDRLREFRQAADGGQAAARQFRHHRICGARRLSDARRDSYVREDNRLFAADDRAEARLRSCRNGKSFYHDYRRRRITRDLFPHRDGVSEYIKSRRYYYGRQREGYADA